MAKNPFLRRLQLGLPTLFGWDKRGYFIPYRYAGSIPESAERQGFPWVETLFREREPGFLDLLSDTETILDIARRFDGVEPPLPRWQQQWFPRLDGLAAYLMVRRHAPKRIIEIGSGHSTRFVAAAIRDGELKTEVTAVDPVPRADISKLPGVFVLRSVLQNADPALFAELEPGDFLMIDSSHIAMPGSDVDLLMGRIVPSLPAGVFVMIHDIFLPDPYPENWAWRGYNEQLPVAALLGSGGFVPVWSSRWISTRCLDFLEDSSVGQIPIAEGIPESALWLQKTV